MDVMQSLREPRQPTKSFSSLSRASTSVTKLSTHAGFSLGNSWLGALPASAPPPPAAAVVVVTPRGVATGAPPRCKDIGWEATYAWPLARPKSPCHLLRHGQRLPTLHLAIPPGCAPPCATTDCSPGSFHILGLLDGGSQDLCGATLHGLLQFLYHLLPQCRIRFRIHLRWRIDRSCSVSPS